MSPIQRLFQLELEYDYLTGGGSLVTAQQDSEYAFADGAQAHGLADTLATATALVRFARNMREL